MPRQKGLTDLLIKDLKDKRLSHHQPAEPMSNGAASSASLQKNIITNKSRAEAPQEHRTEIAIREKRLRCSPHFYNTEAQLEKMAGLLPLRILRFGNEGGRISHFSTLFHSFAKSEKWGNQNGMLHYATQCYTI